MTTEQKISKKRGNEHLDNVTNTVIEASGATISRSKRRKNGNGDIFDFENQESAHVLPQSYDEATSVRPPPRLTNLSSYMEERRTFSVFGASCKEKGVRNRYEKTYASLSKNGLSSNQAKTKQNMDASNKVHIKANQDIECKTTIADYAGKEKQQLVCDSEDRVMAVSNDMQVTGYENNTNQLIFHNAQTIGSQSVLNDKGCLVHVQSPSSLDGKELQGHPEKSCPPLMIKEHQVADPGCPKKIYKTFSSVMPSELLSHVSHSHNPVLQSVAKVARIPTTSLVPNLGASTSAITAISTPITTFPKLPEICKNLKTCEIDNLKQITLADRGAGCQANTSHPTDQSDPSCNYVEERHKKHLAPLESCSRASHHNQEKGFSPDYTDPYIGDSFPVVDIPHENQCLSIEEQNTASVSNNVSNGKPDCYAPVTRNCYISSQQQEILKVETWATQMLQNLGQLYKDGRNCDLVLKFCGGEVLKVHRTILLACTSLVSQFDALQDKQELMVSADLTFASVEPVIRFVYSGCLETHKTDREMSAIYAAAKKLNVPFLTHTMDRHFPYLFQPCVKSLASHGDSKKLAKHKKQVLWKSTSSTAPLNADDAKRLTLEECEGQDTSLYYVVTNSRKYSNSNSPARCKKTEEARPTRFELEEDSENSILKASTWCSESSPPSTPPIPVTPQVITSVPAHPPSSSISVGITSETFTSSSSSQAFSKSLSPSNVKVQKMAPHSTHQQLSHDSSIESMNSSKQHLEIVSDDGRSSDSYESCGVTDIHEDSLSSKNGSGKENLKLMERISNICGQLDEKESNLVNELQEKNSKKGKHNEKSQPTSSENKTHENEDNVITSILDDAAVPIKSILKKKKNKAPINNETKHVSFQLNEDNELINEVAMFSLAKEPSQSLIEVQKATGNTKTSSDTHSPVKLTVSMKKKLLMNLSMCDSEAIDVSNLQVKKLHGKKSSSSSSQGHSKNNVNKGDMTSHAKLISEVLKKYPHLVKDKKKIRLKILKKGNDKDGGGKTKSKVQYLVLSDGDFKSKSLAKTCKSSSLSKRDTRIQQNAHTQHTFECPECDNTAFKTYFMLKKHITAEHKDRSSAVLSRVENVPYACYTCFVNEPLEFGSYYSYQQHMKDVHSKAELRLCNICGFKPGRKLELAYHQYTEHNKVSRSFCFPKCDLCDHVAINDAALLKHRSQHTNADNYTCSVCGVKFCSFGALQGHMQTKLCQTKPSVSHKCPHCPLTFSRSYNLKAHCKSSHKSLQTSPQTFSGAISKQSQDVAPQSSELLTKKVEANSNSICEKNNKKTECGYDVLTVNTSQSSSEAESLSTVANSLAASLGLPEESLSQYVYSQDKIDYSNNLDGEKHEQDLSQPLGPAVHLEAPSTSEYQDFSQCYSKTYSIQTSVQDGSSVSALFPITVVPSEVLPGHIVSGQVLPSQLFQAGCINSPNGSALGPAPQSWTYVTYQVPSSSVDLPVVHTEATNVNSQIVNQHAKTENVNHRIVLEDTEVDNADIKCTKKATSMCEELSSVILTDSEMDSNISQTSFPVTHTYESLSSQFV